MNSLNEQFSQIYDQYIDKIFRFVYLKVGSRETAEDITSKVFTKAWEAFKSQSGEIKNPGAFLYQIARNAVVDHYRSKARAKTVSVDAVPQIADHRMSPQDIATLKTDADIIRRSMGELKKEYQDIIIWHYLEDMPVAEIAILMEKPAGTIRVMLHRGLKELKELIENKGQL